MLSCAEQEDSRFFLVITKMEPRARGCYVQLGGHCLGSCHVLLLFCVCAKLCRKTVFLETTVLLWL